MNYSKKALNTKLLWFSYLMFFLFCACSKSTSSFDSEKVDKILNIQDSEPLTPKTNIKLDSIRHLIGKNDVSRLSKFYKLKHRYYQFNPSNLEKVDQYADSALFLFEEKNLISSHKSFYFDALLIKGDASFLMQKYSQAVLFYLEARSFREKNLDICFNKAVASRIANVYYTQNQNIKAASYYKESFELERNCFANNDPLKHFYEIQALLNNTGFSYERAEMLDSAKHFYQKDLDYIRSCRKKGKIKNFALNDAETIALDNLGSIYLKQGNLVEAESLLLKSISIKYSGDNGVLIPPLIKLAHLYTLKNDFSTAARYFDRSLLLLKVQPNLELESKWEKARSTFYFNQNKPSEAFSHQQKYITLRDSVNKYQSKLSSINIEKDFASLEQNYALTSLAKKDNLKTIYLISTGFLLFLVMIIAALLKRNINQAKRNSKIIQLRNQELQETLLKLEDANENYARVMKVMAHDLKNPLIGIAAISTFLLESKNTLKDNESLEVIKSAAENATELINEILNSVLTSQGEKDFIKSEINIQFLVKECVSLLKVKANEKKQRLILKSYDDIYILANKEKLWRVFNNIIINAIKFSHERTIIEIDIIDEENKVVISITDNGIGLPQDFEHQVFDMFTETKRIGTAGEKPFGLGLSISKQIVEAHNGKIWFENNPTGGTIFYIQLPK